MMAPQQAPQASAPQQQQPMQPQAQPPQQAGGKAAPSGREGQDYNPQILKHIEQHLNSLPQQQQQFLTQYMTPELAMILGIVIGKEAYDYFNKFADPSKMLTVTQRPQQQPSAATQPPQGQPAQSGGQPQAAPQPQPKANTPAKSIMGV